MRKHLVLICFTLIISVVGSTEYCDIKDQSCTTKYEQSDQKFLIYDVNPVEGFNLRRDVYMRFAIMLTEAQRRGKKNNWKLVLPPWYHLYHWRSETAKSQPIPWQAFFDIESMKSYAPVIEFLDVFKAVKSKTLVIDTLYVLKNFEDPFEGGTFIDKWEIENGDCSYDGHYWGYKNITVQEIVCVKFQGRISKIWEFISLHPNDKRVMIDHGEIPLHDNYGTKDYWDCRKSMKFNNELVKTANKYIIDNFNCDKQKCDSYLSIHWRRQDFARSRKRDVPSIAGTVKQIDNAIKTKKLNVNKIFVATDADNSETNLLEKELSKLNYKMYCYTPSVSDLEKYKDGGVAIIDQIICSRGLYFMGTHESTFTFRIQEEREIIGFDSSTTFNRFCPDKGICERPSKWTIVK